MRTKISDWPYPFICDVWKTGDHRWHEVDEETYWEQLECVPPAEMTCNAFAVGEPWSHDKEGAIHTVFVNVDSQFYCRHDHLKNFNPSSYVNEIREGKIFPLEE